MRSLRELLFLQPGELGRAWPFFGLYLLLFGAFSLADGLSLALFVETLGPEALPKYYGVTAGVNLVLIAVYVLVAERVGSLRMFQGFASAMVRQLTSIDTAFLDITPDRDGARFHGTLNLRSSK